MFIEVPAGKGGQSGTNSTITKIGQEYLKLFPDAIEPSYTCDYVEALQIELPYTRDRVERARIKEFLFGIAVNGGNGNGRQ